MTGVPESAADYDSNAKATVNAFVSKHGHDTLWAYLCAHPGRSLVEIAREIGGPPPVYLGDMAYQHCLAHRNMPAFILDLVFRQFQRQLPNGWAAGDDYARKMVFFTRVRQPYKTAVARMKNLLCELAPPPFDWAPTSPRDPVLVQAWEQALAELPPEWQEMVRNGKHIPNPGDVYQEAIAPYLNRFTTSGDARVFAEQFGKVPRELGHVLAAHWCRVEVNNGGIDQLFFNSAGVVAPEGVEGFTAMGMPRCGRLLAEAIKLLGAPYPRDHDARVRAHELLKQGEVRTLGALTDELTKMLGTEAGGFNAAADAYVQKLTDKSSVTSQPMK